MGVVKPDGATRLRVVPLTLPVANAYIARWHRHHGVMPGGFAWWAIGAVDDAGRIVGVALAGRPTNRNNDDGQTVEVLRVAADGHPNTCSMLYGACARAAKAVGAWRVITYTLDEESGASLRGSGWQREKDGIETWWWHPGSRTPAIGREHMASAKVRWGLRFRDLVPVQSEESTELDPQLGLGLPA